MMLSTLLQCCIVIVMQIKLTVVVVVVVERKTRDPGNEVFELLHGILKYNYFFTCF